VPAETLAIPPIPPRASTTSKLEFRVRTTDSAYAVLRDGRFPVGIRIIIPATTGVSAAMIFEIRQLVVLLSALNKRIIVELQERGVAMPSGTELGGRFYIHVANTNHRSSRAYFEGSGEGGGQAG
jgi:hypothetical protein